ncbi:MFS transporter [Metarhizium robertsii]|uniref:Major facilitator superfamily transporter n=2 Tax=Metarhizium robertsii TaxID=568076 RepID=E9EW94_METRA|nr:major facilitator superfamily transporter [Metarhizium robertsii ARSEF 23]EFZ00516.2 major facilitator superfamily transporter [Metarhizium robertsii ARSEF 23]EXV03006.1 MFS transporter [Metarhizium robertsii]
MGLGILEARGHERVPGTTRYFDDPNRPQEASDNEQHLKSDPISHIILVPQPSDDPNDPLNWPIWKRDLITFTLCFAAILATALGAILASNTLVISAYFSATLSDTAALTGYYLLGAGCAAIFFVPSGRIWGKRHLFLIGIIFVIFSSAWGGATGNFPPKARDAPFGQSRDQKSHYNSLAAARAFQGIGAAPFESLLNAAVGDLYCVHQRGVRMAFTNLAVFGGAFFTPVVVGKITHTIGWQWTFYLLAIFSAVTFPAVFLFCPETAYRREAKLNIDSVVEEEKLNPSTSSPSSTAPQPVEPPRPHGFIFFPKSSAMQPIGHANTPVKTFVESMSLFDGRKTHERYWVLFLRPFPLILNPAFVWGCLIQGAMIGWTIFIGVIIAVVFIGPPFFWGEEKAGYTYTAPFLGALLGFIISGLLADTTAKALTKRNNGIYEPEFRLILVIPMLIAAGIGLYGFGITSNDLLSGKYPYTVPLVFFAFEVGGMVIGSVASSLYIVDAYRDLTIEGFTLMIIFKNIFSFVLTFYAYDWVIGGGFRTVFLIVASIQMGICLLSLPLYIFGKRIRAFYTRNDLLALTRLR